MKQIISVVVFMTFLVGIFSSSAISVYAEENKNVVLSKDQVINRDYFATGDNITLSGTVNGDAYIAGGNVIIEGVVNGDLLAAGGNVNIRGKVRDDVRVAGGQITITGEVGRNITALGGSVNIADSANVTGSLTAGTGSLSVFAPIGKEANFGAGQATIGNTINGDVQAGVGQLTMTSNAKVLGNLTYWSEETARIDPGAEVSGATTHNLPPAPRKVEIDEAKGAAALAGIGSVFNILSFLAALVVGLLLITFMPVYSQQTANLILQKPFLSLGVGFLAILLAPFIFIVLLITIIGIPLNLILLSGLLIFIYLAKIFVSIAIGQKVLLLLSKKAALGWAFVLGLFIYYVLTLIPILGFVFWMIAGLIGVGAILLERKYVYSDLRKKHLI